MKNRIQILLSFVVVIIAIVAASIDFCNNLETVKMQYYLKEYREFMRSIILLDYYTNLDTSKIYIDTVNRVDIRPLPSLDPLDSARWHLIQKYSKLPQCSNSPLTLADPVERKFWAKVIFSGVFCIAALYVILSNKYDDETKKWAFSVLTLIAGVWIGSI